MADPLLGQVLITANPRDRNPASSPGAANAGPARCSHRFPLTSLLALILGSIANKTGDANAGRRLCARGTLLARDCRPSPVSFIVFFQPGWRAGLGILAGDGAAIGGDAGRFTAAHPGMTGCFRASASLNWHRQKKQHVPVAALVLNAESRSCGESPRR